MKMLKGKGDNLSLCFTTTFVSNDDERTLFTHFNTLAILPCSHQYMFLFYHPEKFFCFSHLFKTVCANVYDWCTYPPSFLKSVCSPAILSMKALYPIPYNATEDFAPNSCVELFYMQWNQHCKSAIIRYSLFLILF
jgi:hypothetical protein